MLFFYTIHFYRKKMINKTVVSFKCFSSKLAFYVTLLKERSNSLKEYKLKLTWILYLRNIAFVCHLFKLIKFA